MAIIPGQMAIASSSILENLIPGKSVDLTQVSFFLINQLINFVYHFTLFSYKENNSVTD